MDVEEELLSFLNNLPQRVGQPRMDGSPRKMAELRSSSSGSETMR
jgi:hypothetical protein